MASNQYRDGLEEARAVVKGLLNDMVELDKRTLQIAANAAKIGKTDFSGGSPKELNERLQKNATYRKQVNAEMKEAERLNKALAAAQAKFYSAQSGKNKQLQQTRIDTNILNKEQRDAAKLNSRLTNAYEKQSVTLNRLRREAKGAAVEYGVNSSEAIKLRKEVNKLDKELKAVDKSLGQSQRFVGEYERGWLGAAKNIKNIATSLIGAFGITEGLRITFDFLKESRQLAVQAKGVEFAFENIGKTGVDAFESIKKSTRGTLSDLDIKTAIVEFDNFGLSLERSNTLFEFLAVTASQTGKSIDELQSSLVEGLSKKSTQRIDNLGISASQLNDELKETPDFVEAVANIAERKLASAGNILDEAGNSQAKWNADLKNFQLLIGNDLVNDFSDALYSAGSNLLRLITPTKSYVKEIKNEQTELNLLVNQITDVNISNDKREQLLNSLSDKYPSFLKFLNQEKTDNESLSAALREVNDLYIKRIALQTQQEKIEKLLKKSGDQAYDNAKNQIEVSRELAKINSSVLKGSLDLTNKSYEDRLSLVVEALKQNAEYSKSLSTGTVTATNEEAKALQRLSKLTGQSIVGKSKLSIVNKELTEEQKVMAELEEVLGTTVDKVNNVLDNNTNKVKKNTDIKNEGIQALDGSIAAMEQVISSLEEEQSKLAVSDKRWASYEKSIKDAKDALAQLKVEYAGVQVLFEQEGVSDFDPFALLALSIN